MEQTKIKKLIVKALKPERRFWNEEQTELNQNKLLDVLENFGEKENDLYERAIELLSAEKDLREKFFVCLPEKAGENQRVFVFRTNDFRFFMEENKIDNSYTAYKNRIGLTDGKKFLKDTDDVVLDFPYKDCVLEGGQSTEEGTDTYFEYSEKADKYEKKQGKRKEIFFNSVLAHDEIDRLFDPKALTNWKKFTAEGEIPLNLPLKKGEAGGGGILRRDKDGTIKENLIIKGNNLLALHSLKKQFAGKIKLIYIDPPYNTGNDGFKYNDNFNHSTWLTFMKNRLEVAKELLRDDGVIFVQCDDNEQAYLKVLMDDVFGRENFVNNFVWQKKSSGSQHSRFVLDFHEYITVFSKNIHELSVFKVARTEKQKQSFKLEDDYLNTRGKYLLSPLKSWLDYRKTLIYEIKCPDGTFVKTQWVCGKDTFKKLKSDDRIVFKKSNKNEWSVYKKQYENDRDGEVKPASLLLEDGQNMQATRELIDLFDGKLFSNPKPEKLLMKVIEMSTEKGDIVLDYHLGSGTTCAVAHKMGRQYIGIEQMDYIESIACERLKKVVAGEQGGISKSVNWQGGGDFIYFELAKWNETAKEKIQASKSLEELIDFFDEMYDKYFLNYNLKIKEFREKVIIEENFKKLSLDEQKQIFLAMLDNNQMYVNKTEMADKKFGIDREDQELTKQFYNNEQ